MVRWTLETKPRDATRWSYVEGYHYEIGSAGGGGGTDGQRVALPCMWGARALESSMAAYRDAWGRDLRMASSVLPNTSTPPTETTSVVSSGITGSCSAGALKADQRDDLVALHAERIGELHPRALRPGVRAPVAPKPRVPRREIGRAHV